MIGFVRFFIAERLRQRSARHRARQAEYPEGALAHEESKAVADCYDALAEMVDQREERRQVMTLACSYPITLTTAKRYHRKCGDSAEAAIELELRSGRMP